MTEPLEPSININTSVEKKEKIQSLISFFCDEGFSVLANKRLMVQAVPSERVLQLNRVIKSLYVGNEEK
jgi:hypothetical protein